MGSIESVRRIGATNSVACINKLYALEGAIQRIRWHSLTKEEKESLKKEYLNRIEQIEHA